MHYVGRIRRSRRIRHQHAATLIPPFECQCFALDQTHHQRQQAVDDQVNNPCRTEHHYIVGASVQQLAVSHHFHQRNGVSQREACQDWGMQFRTDSYQKLSLILIQSFTKGGREAAMLMEAEEREAFHKRIDRAKKEGEEASTRLLFPMILLLCQVMLLVMYPALTRFQGF